jgi:Zn-dependent protease with chaperone function
MRWGRGLRSAIAAWGLVTVGCAGIDIAPPPAGGSAPSSTAGRSAPQPAQRPADQRDVERLSRAMIPVLRVANNPVPLDRVRVGVVNDATINAGSAGGGQFIVTRGLLDRANDQVLQAVLAHEVAHDDLGHVGRLQTLGTGLSVGAAILDQIFPGTGQVAPLAGELVMRAYSRREELEADRHAVDLLRKAGARPEAMEGALVWLKETVGNARGGFFSTHPGTDERIAALRRLR